MPAAVRLDHRPVVASARILPPRCVPPFQPRQKPWRNTMKRRRALDLRPGLVLGIAGGVAAALGASPALALPSCSVAALNALGVPNLTVTSAVPSATDPTVCVATGTVATSGFGAPDGSARFQVQLPTTNWNSKFVFFGQGG